MIKRTKKVMATLMIAIMMSTTSYTVYAADDDKWTEATQTTEAQNGAWEAWCEKWEIIKDDWTQLSITPGRNQSELNFAWYSKVGEENPEIKVSENSDMSEAKTFTGTQSNAVPEYVSNKVTITGLKENSTYYYTYGTDGVFSDPVEFKTQNSSSFGFILIGDPQVGSSSKNVATGGTDEQGQDNATRNDSFNWNTTINKALTKQPNTSFILSAGDQIQSRDKKATAEEAMVYTGNEIEYAGYLSPDALKSLPVATTLGNHDAVSGNYSYHFNNPNASDLGSTVGGGNYYYTYGNTLFIMLNTNNTNEAEHRAFIEQAVAENEDATWRVVTLHQDIYGSAEHSNEPKIAELRYKLVPIFEDNNIDIVLAGHDHAYTRSKILKGGSLVGELLDEDLFAEHADAEYETEIPSDNEEYLDYLERIEDEDAIVNNVSVRGENISNPDGILYITAGSSTGSKYYNNLIRQQAYVESRWQEYVPTFSTINVDDVSLSVSTYRVDTMEKIDDSVTIVKSVEYGNLVGKIEEAESLVKDNYTVDSWAVVEAALAEAQVIACSSDFTEATVSNAYGNLVVAINDLDEKGNAESLQSVIKEAEELISNSVVGTEVGQYPQEAKDALVQAIEEAKKVVASVNATQQIIDDAEESIEKAISTFKATVVVKDVVTDNGSNNNNNSGSTNGGNNNNTSVNTGDNSSMYVIGVLLIAIGAVVGLNFKKKKRIN